MIAGVGGIVLVISLFLTWDDSFGSQSAFDLFSGVDIILLLIGIAALAYAGLTAAGSAANLPAHSAFVIAVLGVLAVGMALSITLEDSAAGIGAWLGLFASIAIAYGAYETSRSPAARISRPAAPPPPPPAAPSASEPSAGVGPGGSTPPPGA